MRNKLISYVESIKFFLKKKDCRVIFFKAPSNELFSYLDYDIIQRVSSQLDLAQQTDLDELDKNILSFSLETNNADNTVDDTVYLKLKSLLKLAWLVNDLKTNPMRNPIQLLQSGSKYFCHPGSDRIIVTTYLQPVDFICGFYLWYPEFDDHPFILDYEHYEIKCPFSFVSKFTFSNTLKIKTVTMNNDLDVSDKDKPTLSTRFEAAKKCFDKTLGKYDFFFMSFDDRMQWDKIEGKVYFRDVLKFTNDTECYLADIKFTKINGTWIAND